MEIINEKNFEEKTKKGIVVVDFFANWCGPCKMMAPVLEQIAKELDGKATFYKVDVDQDEDLARKFGVMMIPTIVILENGEQREKHIGLWQKDDCKDEISSYCK